MSGWIQAAMQQNTSARLDCKYVSQVDSLGDDRKILFIRFCKVILWYTNELILMRKAYRQYKPVFTLLHY